MPAMCRSSRLAFALLLPLTLLPLIGPGPVLEAQEAAPPNPGTAATTPNLPALVLAVDTSRSLSPAALAATLAEAGRTLAALPSGLEVGVLAFDDEPRWQAQPGPAATARASLGALRPQGNYTLLHDALFEATRRLEQGGVILLLTDGRDENSATTVEDIARRCEAQKVRIFPVGIGKRVDDKALRRLALLTRGRYLGQGLDAGKVAAALQEGLREVGAELQAEKSRREASRPAPQGPRAAGPAAQPESPGPAAPPPVAAAARPAGPTGPAADTANLLDYLPWLLAALLALGFFLYVFSRQQAARRSAAAELESERLEEESLVADEADAAAIRLELAQVPVAQPRDSPEVTVDTAVLQRMTLDERLERTRVLSSMLLLKKPGEAPRSFLLDRDKAFAVGRDRDKNTLAVPDPSLSSQHFRIVPRAGAYFFVDLESTNGSYIGSRKVRAKRLRAGDVIRAGQVEFEYQSYGDTAF